MAAAMEVGRKVKPMSISLAGGPFKWERKAEKGEPTCLECNRKRRTMVNMPCLHVCWCRYCAFYVSQVAYQKEKDHLPCTICAVPIQAFEYSMAIKYS